MSAIVFRWVVFLTSCPVASVGDLARVRYAAVMMDSGFLESPRLFVWLDFFFSSLRCFVGRSFFFSLSSDDISLSRLGFILGGTSGQ